MKINEFKKLENTINGGSFRDSYKNINSIMLFLSIVGHLTSIFLAYFLVFGVLIKVVDSQPLLMGALSILLLTGLELLKRDFFDKFSFQYLKNKSLFSKDVIPLATVSFLIVMTSFYLSIKGASEFSSRSKEIEVNKIEIVQNYTDSLNIVYGEKIKIVDNEIALKKDKIEEKDSEQTILESSDKIGSQQRNRIRDLKQEKLDLKNEIKELEDKQLSLSTEKDSKISDFENSTNKGADQSKSENKTNSIFFVIISTIIELTILFGVYFNKYYKFRSYIDFKGKIESDPNYQRWMMFDSILQTIYVKDVKVGQKIGSLKSIQDLCKVNDIIISSKDLTDFMKLITSLGIMKSSGSSRYYNKNKESAIESLKSHFNID